MGAGTLFGLAVLMKQQAIFYPPLALGLLVWMSMTSPAPDRRGLVRQAATLLAGMALPFVVLCTVLAAQGVLGRFWFWTFTYASTYASEVPLSEVPHLFAHSWDRIMRVSWPFWTMAAAGGAGVWLVRWATRTRVVLVSLLLASCLAVCPGFYFREHYFILILPSVALFTGVLAVSIEAIARRRCSHAAARALAVVAVLAAPVWYVAHEHAYLFTMSPRDVSRETYELNPFIEAVDVARYLKDHTTPDDRIAVLGSEPEIYFYANRKSATGYIYTYALMEPQPYAAQMQREMMGQIEAAHPKYVVLVPMRASWGFSPASDKTILEWTDRYVEQCYDMVGLADIYSFAETTMLWDDQVRVGGYRPRSEERPALYSRPLTRAAGPTGYRQPQNTLTVTSSSGQPWKRGGTWLAPSTWSRRTSPASSVHAIMYGPNAQPLSGSGAGGSLAGGDPGACAPTVPTNHTLCPVSSACCIRARIGAIGAVAAMSCFTTSKRWMAWSSIGGSVTTSTWPL
jgi:hypothetical protein